MRGLLFLLTFFLSCQTAIGQGSQKISQLPLIAASTTTTNDSFPYVDSSNDVTSRLTIWDISNIPTLVSTYAAKNNPVFTGSITFSGPVTASSGITGSLTGTATGNTTYTPSQYGVVVSGASNAMSVIAASTANAVFVANGVSANPNWSLLSNSNLNGSAGITNANLASMSTLTIKGNSTGGSTTPSDLSVAQVNTMLGLANSATSIGTFDGQSGQATGLDLVSNVLYGQSATASVPGMVNTGTQTFAGTKTFTGAVNLSSALIVTGNITGNAVTVSSAIPVPSGGSGLSTISSGYALVGNGTGAMSTVAPGTSNNVLTSNGSTWVSQSATTPSLNIFAATTTGSITTASNVILASGSLMTLQLPTAVGNAGKQITVIKTDSSYANIISIIGTSGQTVVGLSSVALFTQNDSATFIADGTQWQLVSHTIPVNFSSTATVISATSSPPTKASSPTYDILGCYRSGGYLNCFISYYASSASGAGAGSGDYLFGIPSGIGSIDTTQNHPNQTVLAGGTTVQGGGLFSSGQAFMNQVGSSEDVGYFVIYNTISLRMIQQGTGTYRSVNSSNYNINTASIQYTGNFSVPIRNWGLF